MFWVAKGETGFRPVFEDILIEVGDMLELRPGCECCDRDLPPETPDARICTFECTFCVACAEDVLHGICPNCSGELVRRPVRPAAMLLRHPASTRRVLRAEGCNPAG